MPPNNNIHPGGSGPLNLMFANQFKRITRVNLRVFILKVANWGPHRTFCERNAMTRYGFNLWHSARGPALI